MKIIKKISFDNFEQLSTSEAAQMFGGIGTLSNNTQSLVIALDKIEKDMSNMCCDIPRNS